MLFGLTGGVATGKTTVANRFREQGLEVLDADAMARQLVEPGRPALAEIVDAFGAEVLTAEGELDRPRLGRIVFSDDRRRARLNVLLHPRIRAETQRRVEVLAERGVGLACYEAALLVENGLADEFRPLVVTSAPRAVQLSRLLARDGLPEAQAGERIGAQLPLADKVRLADHVIDTTGTLAETLARADGVLSEIRAVHQAGLVGRR